MKPDSDEAFREWIKTQPSCVSCDFKEYDAAGDGVSIPCHVRRAGEAGTAYKPPFSCVPMTFDEHALQSSLGELACLEKYLPPLERIRLFHGCVTHEDRVARAKWFFDDQAAKYLAMWRATL